MLRNLAVLAVAVMLATAAAAIAHPMPVVKVHRRGCNTARCDRWADAQTQDHLEARRRRRIARERREARRAARSMSALERCIIRNESGGNPQAVNGIYSGIGQWEQSRWESDGGLRYGEHPRDATYAEQEKVLRGEGAAGMIEQQGQYDGCA